MKKRRIFIYIMVTIILICGIGYAYLNTDLSLENNVSLTSLKRYTVTFDYNDEVTEPTTKTVIYGKEYGSLPEPPEREGYRFLGWHGKNLSRENWKQGDFEGGNYTIRVSTNDRIYVTSGQTITVSINSLPLGIMWAAQIFDNSGQTSGNMAINWTTQTNINYTANQNDEYLAFIWGKQDRTAITPSEIDNLEFQVEYGNISTAYEPYYVTSDTKVTQDKNHTLTAIWEKE